MNRRTLLTAAAPGVVALFLAGCTAGAIDPAKVSDAIKVGCGIAVAAAQIAEILKLDPTLSVSAIVSLICTGFQTAKESGKLGAGGEVVFPVMVNGHTVTIHAKVVS